MKKILVLEDDYDIGEIVEMTLNSTYRILVKQDSRQLADVLTEFNPDLILIDNFIGDRNAAEVIDELKLTGFHINVPLILFSAYEDIKALATQIGAVDYIAKPFNLDELNQCISRILTIEKHH